MDRLRKITEALGLSDDIMKEIEQKILTTMNNNIYYDYKINAFKAFGEDRSARILSAYITSIGIQAEYVNSKDAGIIVEKDPLEAKLLPESNNKIYELRKREGISIIPGFFGYTSTGELATFSRGGSDITGAII